MNRAVGRGPPVDGPLVFFKIGCGIGAGALDIEEAVVVIPLLVDGPLGRGRLSAVVLEAPGPCWKLLFGGEGPSTRFGGPRSGTKVGPFEI